MKTKFILAGAMAALFCFTSCSEKEENFSLKDTYHLDKVLVAQGAGFNEELYTFTIELAEEGVSGSNGSYTGTGKVVKYQFYGSKYYLDSSVYPATNAGAEADGSYIPSQSTVYDVVNGQVTAKGITEGYVYVNKSGKSYRFGTTSKLSDGSEFKFVSGCEIDFPKLPKYKYKTNMIQTYDAGGKYVIDFGDEGIYLDNGSVVGNGEFFHLEINNLTSVKDGVYNPGEYVKGFQNDTYAAWGYVWDEGSRVIDAATGSALWYIDSQVITISTLDNGNRKIAVDCDDVVYIYEGKI